MRFFMDFLSFFFGYVFCMLADVVFSAANCLIQYAFKLRDERKRGDK